MALSDDLLLNTLRTLQASVDNLQSTHNAMQSELHAAVLDNTKQITALDGRVAGVEHNMRRFKADAKKEAIRWGTVGGAAASAGAIIVALVKYLFTKPHA